MSDSISGVPVTYIGGGGGSSGTVTVSGTVVVPVPMPVSASSSLPVTVQSGGTVSVENAGQPIYVYILGGTSTSEVVFTGSINTDIGNVKIEDADDNYAVVPVASAAKNGSTNALVVQHIDDTGIPLRQSTQTQIMNGQGTIATEATQISILNALGTLAPTSGQATEATLIRVLNAQGTLTPLTTGAKETTQISILNAFGTLTPLSGGAAETTQIKVLNAQGTLATETTLAAMRAQGTTSNESLADIDLNTYASALYLQALVNSQGTLTPTTGGALETTQIKVMNDQGTLATFAAQTTGNTYLGAMLGNQGTQATESTLIKVMNALGTLTPSGGAGASESTLIRVMNDQGTLATAVNQSTEIGLLQTLITTVGTASGTILTATLFNAQIGAATSPSVDVSGRVWHTVQHVVNGAGSVTTQTSLDGSNWYTEAVTTSSDMLALEGMARYIRAVAGGSGTITSLLLSSQPAPTGGGGGQSAAESSFSGTVSPSLGATTTFSTNNANSVGFYMVVPTGATIIFEGSWDNASWEPFTLRQMGAHGYSQTSNNTEFWVGSCSTWRYIRFRTSVAGTGAGSVVGKFTYGQNSLEGIEHGFPPHKVGVTAQSVHITIGTTCSNQIIATPSDPSHKLCVTDILLNVDSNTTITLSDGSISDGLTVFKVTAKPASNTSAIYPLSFTMPHVFSGANRSLRFTSTATANVDINVHYYETES